MNDPIARVGTIALIGLVLFITYRLFSPNTHFEADGVDAAWDAAVQNRDQTEPTLVIFTASWCPACRALEGNVLSQSEIQQELARHYNVHWVDLSNPTQEVGMHANRLGVHAIPTLIFYNVDGTERTRNHGGSEEQVMSCIRAGE
jgi:thiol:disulfide interchange protein DsbD